MVEKITIWSYLEPFLCTREILHLAEISRALRKNHSTVRKHLNFFEKQGILEKKIKGRLTMYVLKFSLPLIVDYLVLAEKEKLINRCKKDLLINEFVGFLHSNLSENNKAVIFGSSAIDSKGAKDIDLLVTGKTNAEEGISQFEKKFNVKIHLLNVTDLKSVSESLRKEIMAKHLIVQGSEEVVKWLI